MLSISNVLGQLWVEDNMEQIIHKMLRRLFTGGWD